MEKYIGILDSLMSSKKEKKKKDPNTKEKEAFRSAWVSLASEAGFVGRAEQFLYEGFSFCGAEPFYKYLINTKDKNAAISELFNGKHYGNDSNVAFRLVTHLLALMLNDNAPGNVLAPIIKCFPGAAINKSKKRLGTAEKTVEKYFLAELLPDVVLCPLADIGIKPIFVKEFVALLSSVLDGIENSGAAKGVVAENITKIRKWFADYEAPQIEFPENKTVRVKRAPVVEEEDVNFSHKANGHQKKGDKSLSTHRVQPVEESLNDITAYLVDLLNTAGKAAIAARTESIQQKSKIVALIYSIEGEQEKLRLVNQQIADQQDTIAELRKKLSAAEGDVLTLKNDIAQRDAVIAAKTAEIKERIEMADVLSRDRSNQANETLQRLASKIKVEYRDFVDAIGVAMSCDLGENLRLQLQSIFDILEKGGMRIK